MRTVITQDMKYLQPSRAQTAAWLAPPPVRAGKLLNIKLSTQQKDRLMIRAFTFVVLLAFMNALPGFAQDTSSSKALEALDKALKQNSRKDTQESKPQTIYAYLATSNGIFDITGIRLGMTCEQARNVFGSFKQGNCDDCKPARICRTVSRVNIDALEYHCFMDFDASGRLESISLSRGFRNDKLSVGMEAATEVFTRYSDIIRKKHGKPHVVKGAKMEVVHYWVFNGNEFYLSTDNDEDVSIVYGKK